MYNESRTITATTAMRSQQNAVERIVAVWWTRLSAIL
jgi:hypothetical protein